NSYGGGATDAYLLKVNAAGSSKTYAKYIGGTTAQIGKSIDLVAHSPVVPGTVSGPGTFAPGVNPVSGANLPGFVTQYDDTGANVIFSSLIGTGGNTDQAYGVSCTATGTIYVGGENVSASSIFVGRIDAGIDALIPSLTSITMDTGAY